MQNAVAVWRNILHKMLMGSGVFVERFGGDVDFAVLVE